MATVTSKQRYEGTITEDGTVTVSGRGECRVKIVGNTWGSGTIALSDDLCVDYAAIDDAGTAQTISTGSRTWVFDYEDVDKVNVRLTMSGSSTPDVDVLVSFTKAPQ